MNFIKLFYEVMNIYGRPNQYNNYQTNMYKNPVNPNMYTSQNFLTDSNYRDVNKYYKEKLKSILYKQI